MSDKQNDSLGTETYTYIVHECRLSHHHHKSLFDQIGFQGKQITLTRFDCLSVDLPRDPTSNQ
jgi:hypothetical protein